MFPLKLRKYNLPTCRTSVTRSSSKSCSPFWNGNLLKSVWQDDVCKDEYIQISFSFLGNDQNTTLSCTGSGTRTSCSSTRWNGIVEATHCALRSSKDSGWNLRHSCEIFLSFCNFVEGEQLLRRFLCPSIRLTEVFWRMRCSDVNIISQARRVTPGGRFVE